MADSAAQRGARWGWIGGWLGSVGWIGLIAVGIGARGQWLEALVGLLICALGVALSLWLTPWRFPRTRFWRLMLPLYLVILAGSGWTLWAFGLEEAQGLRWWQLGMLLPLLTPLVTLGSRRWVDTDAGQ